MYVDVTICRRERKKVEITLAKRSARAMPVVVPIPVKTAEKYDAIAETELESAEFVEDELEAEYADIPEEPEFDEESEDAEETFVDEAEAERMAEETMNTVDEMLAEAEADVAEALDELDDMTRINEDIIERLDDELAEAIDEINDSAEEDVEKLNTTIDKELEELDSVLVSREESEEEPAEAATVMRYFDRDSNGDRIEVEADDEHAQEVICYDGESGKLSRAFGIIKKNSEES